MWKIQNIHYVGNLIITPNTCYHEVDEEHLC